MTDHHLEEDTLTTAGRHRGPWGRADTWWWAVGGSTVLGAATLGAAYTVAATAPDLPWARYTLFWVGALVGVVPLVAVAVHPAAPRAGRTWALVTLALFTYLPRVLRSPHHPAMYDEKLHVGQAGAIDHAGTLFGVPNPVVPAIEHYPGLHALLVGGHRLTGASYYHVGVVVVAVAHVAMLLAVAALARRLGAGDRVAATAGALYALTPGFWFFDAMVAYQSVALPVAVWALVGVLALLDGDLPRRRAAGVAVAVVAGIVAVGITHHVTTGVLCAFCTVVAVCRGLGRGVRGRDRALAVGALGAGVAAVVVQAILLGPALGEVFEYVLPDSDWFSVQGLWESVTAGSSGDGHSRAAFSGSVLPTYERLAGFAAPAITLALTVAGLTWGRALLADGWVRRLGWVTVVAYPATFPLIFSARGATWAHRSWPFLLVLAAPYLAAGLVAVCDRAATAARAWRPGTTGRAGVVVAVVVAAVWLVGNTATSTNDQWRFPGVHELGVEGRSVDEHTLAAAAWLAGHAGPGARFTSEASTAVDMVGFAGAWKVRGFPTWELLRAPDQVDADDLALVAARDVDYLIVDARVAGLVPARGYLFEDYEPGAHTGTAMLDAYALARLDHQAWADPVFRSGPVTVYALDPVGVDPDAVAGVRDRLPEAFTASDRAGWELYPDQR